MVGEMTKKKPCYSCNVPDMNNGACCLDEATCSDIANYEKTRKKLKCLDPLKVLEAVFVRDIKNAEQYERESYDYAMRNGDRREYLNLIQELQTNPDKVIKQLKDRGILE